MKEEHIVSHLENNLPNTVEELFDIHFKDSIYTHQEYFSEHYRTMLDMIKIFPHNISDELLNEFDHYYKPRKDEERVSFIAEILLATPYEEIPKSSFSLFRPNLNIASKDILDSPSFSLLANNFALYFRKFDMSNSKEWLDNEDYNNFNFYGMTLSDFTPSKYTGCSETYVQSVSISKMTNPNIIKRKLISIYKQELELQQIRRGKVTEYMSDVAYNVMLDGKKRSDEYLSQRYITIGEEDKTLLELQETQKTNKMNELCVIKNHINSLVNDGSYGCRFITMTNKPEELPRGYNSKDKTHWNGVSTPKDNVKQLQRRWRTIQSYANRKGIPLIGIWCREPHKKGGIHQHILVFTKKDFLENDKVIKNMTKNQTKNLLGKYKAAKNEILANEDTTLEKMFLDKFGYTNRSCKIDVLDGGKTQNIVNYITKYIMKTIDLREYNGTSIDNDKTHLNKVSFHRSLWGYRAYGFFGFDKRLGKWRFLRKIMHNEQAMSVIDKGTNLYKAVRAVKENDFTEFLEYSGCVDFMTKDTFNIYGEKSSSIIGIRDSIVTHVLPNGHKDLELVGVYSFNDFDDLGEDVLTCAMLEKSPNVDFYNIHLPKYEVLRK